MKDGWIDGRIEAKRAVFRLTLDKAAKVTYLWQGPRPGQRREITDA